MNNLIPFSLPECIAGAKVITRDGQEYRFGAYNPDALSDYKLAGWVNDMAVSHTEQGHSIIRGPQYDLFMAPIEVVEYRNVYNDCTFGKAHPTLKDAIEFNALDVQLCVLCITTINDKKTVTIVHNY